MEPTNQPSQINREDSKSKKGLYIIIGIIVLLLIVWLVMRASGSMRSATIIDNMNGVTVDRNLDGSATYSNSEGSVTVGINKLPTDWPSDAPAYSNAQIQYSGSSNPQTGEAGIAVMFTTTDSAVKVTDFYKKELILKGWKVEQTTTMGASTVLAAKKDTRTFGISITDTGNGQVSVMVGISETK